MNGPAFDSSEATPKQIEWLDKFDAAIDAAWEGANLYDRYHIDTAILNNKSAILSVDRPFTDDSQTRGGQDSIRQAKKMLEARYAELLEQGKVPLSKDSDWDDAHEPHDIARHKLHAVEKEWVGHYLMPRLTVAESTDYDSWVEAAVIAGNIDPQKTRRQSYETGRRNIALSDLEMIPLWGSAAHEIIVPPIYEVTGNLGHSVVYEWERLGEEGYHPEAVLYPSTLDRLASNGLYKVTKAIDLEIKLRLDQSNELSSNS